MSKPEFKARSLIETPNSSLEIGFLEGDFGKYVDEEVHKRYARIRGISQIKYDGKIVGKLTLPYGVAVNEIIEKDNLRTATPADLERILKVDESILMQVYFIRHPEWDKKTYPYDSSCPFLFPTEMPFGTISALALSNGTGNLYLAENLMKQVKARNPKEKMPVVIPLKSLKLAKINDNPYEVEFQLKDNAEVIYAPILNKKSDKFCKPLYFKSSDINEKTGLPIKLSKEGDRELYTSKEGGLRGFSLGCSQLHGKQLGWSLDSSFTNFTYSNEPSDGVIIREKLKNK